MELVKKKRYLIILIIAILVIISLGTYAWLSYRTNDTAMVLTVGDINNVRITMSPYQIDAKISPNLTYTGQKYTTVEVVNNSSSPRNIKLFYTINAIDSELATSNLKYTIEKKAVGASSYAPITPDGDFNGASRGDVITILEEEAPVGTTMYKVYVWLYSASSSSSSVIGKKFNAELNATIGEDQYVVTLNANNGTVSPETIVVDAGGTYQNLPTPTREGYTFLGWNGKNKLNTNVPISNPSSTVYDNTTARTFIPNTYVKGLAYNNYYNSSNINTLTLSTGSVILVAKSGYGVGFPLLSDASKSYTLSFNTSGTTYRGVSSLYYDSSGSLINYSQTTINSTNMIKNFTTPNNTHYLVIDFYGSDINTTINITNIQLEEGSTATAYEPYYITNGTSVVQNQNHTLTAIWEKNNS